MWPLNEANNWRCSSTVRLGYKISCCGHTPRFLRISGICSLMSMPSRRWVFENKQCQCQKMGTMMLRSVKRMCELGVVWFIYCISMCLHLSVAVRSYTCLPSMIADPAVGGNKPVNIPIAVVFPAPLWPNKAVIWPEYIVRFKPSTAVLMPVGVENSLYKLTISTHLLSVT